MVEYKSLKKNSPSIVEKDNAFASYRNMTGYILEANFEGQGWSSRLLTLLLIVTWELTYSQKGGVNRKIEEKF